MKSLAHARAALTLLAALACAATGVVGAVARGRGSSAADEQVGGPQLALQIGHPSEGVSAVAY